MPAIEAKQHRNRLHHAHNLLRKPRFVTERGERHTFEYDRLAPSIALRVSSSGSQTFISSSDARLLYAMLGKMYEPHPRPGGSNARRLRPGEASTLPQLDRPAVTDPEHILYPSEPEKGRPGNPYAVYNRRRRMFFVVRDRETGDGGKKREAAPEALQITVQKAVVTDIAANYGVTPDPTLEGRERFFVAKDVALTAFPDMVASDLRPTLDDRLADEAAAMERMRRESTKRIRRSPRHATMESNAVLSRNEHKILNASFRNDPARGSRKSVTVCSILCYPSASTPSSH